MVSDNKGKKIVVKTPKGHLHSVKRLRNPEGARVEQLRLDKNERTTPFPEKNWREMINSFNPELLTVYPEITGITEKIAKAEKLSPEQIYLTAGSDLAIKGCYEAFIAPGSEVVYLSPTFAMVDVYAKLFNAKVTQVSTNGQLSTGIGQLIEKVTEKTSLVIVANPNSPTGTSFSISDLEKLIAHCQSFECPILIDEAYYYFHKQTAMGLIAKYPNLLVSRTFSKAVGLAGVRLGFLAGDKETVELVSKWRPLYEVNTFAVHMGEYLMDHPEIIESYVSEVDRAKAEVYAWGERLDIPVFHSDANFVNVRVGKTFIPEIVARCQQQKILLRGAGQYVLDDQCVRISFGTAAQVRPVMEIIRNVVRGK